MIIDAQQSAKKSTGERELNMVEDYTPVKTKEADQLDVENPENLEDEGQGETPLSLNIDCEDGEGDEERDEYDSKID